MKRREIVALIGSAAAAWPLGVHAQQSTMPVVGWLSPQPLNASQHFIGGNRLKSTANTRFNRAIQLIGVVHALDLTGFGP